MPMLMALFAVPIAGMAATPATAAGGIALLTDVQAQDMGNFDRVTFTFEGGTPTIQRADYISGPVLQTTSGLPVEPPVGGDARILVNMGGASTVDQSVNPPVVTYTGPPRIAPGLPSVVELVQVEDFEAVLGWVIAIHGPEVAATAQVLSGPTRVVVDIPHTEEIVAVSPSFTG